jgi:hypothetical protein
MAPPALRQAAADHRWKIDTRRFCAVPFGTDGKPLAPVDLYQFFKAYHELQAYHQENSETALSQWPWSWSGRAWQEGFDELVASCLSRFSTSIHCFSLFR